MKFENNCLELYIHIPFCTKKCSYCDFLSFPVGIREHEGYVRKLCEELRYRSGDAGGYTVGSVFLGGGTPSVLAPTLIARIMETVYANYAVAPDAEITIECNPASTLRYKFSLYQESGINRLSLGLQSANNSELRRLGRLHIFEDFLKSYQNARLEGFRNINIDLMNGIPEQTPDSWRKTLRNVLMLKPEHLSVYNLILEEGTPFYRLHRAGTLELPTEDSLVEMDNITRELCLKSGYLRYEISNYARPGFECRHNYGYWSDVPYLGFGLGASSYFNKKRFRNLRNFTEYLALDFQTEAAAQFPQLYAEQRELSRKEQMEEFMFLGLRRVSGVSELDFTARFSVELQSVFGEKLRQFISMGLMRHEGCRYRFTERGMDVSNRLLSEFLLD